MKRDPKKASLLPDPLREAVGLPIGPEGAYYVGADRFDGGPGADDSVLDYNHPPGDPGMQHGGDFMDDFNIYLVEREEARDNGAQPGLWCQWVPSEDGTSIIWDDGEKFYEYTRWLVYLIENFLKPWGYILNGEVNWHGEESSDQGCIFVKNNEVRAVAAEITIENPFAS